MRILIISPFLFRYERGIERFSVSLANHLAQRGHSVNLVAWRSPHGQWPWGDLAGDVTLTTMYLPRYFQRLWAGISYARLLRRKKPDRVLVNFLWHGEDAALRRGRSYVGKTVLVLNSPYWQVPSRYDHVRQSGLLEMGLHVVAVSAFVADGITEALGRHATVIPNGVDVEHFVPAARKDVIRKRLGLPGDQVVLISVAALEERKGIAESLRALAEAIRKVPKLLYLIVGDGPEEDNLRELAIELGVESNVRFLGDVGDPAPWLRASDVFVALAKGEALPLAPLEAMATGLPLVVATERPFDEICHPKGAVFVNRGNARRVGEVLVALARDLARGEEMGRTNREWVVSRFSWDRIATLYDDLFSTM